MEHLALSTCLDTAQQALTTGESVWRKPQFEHLEADREHLTINITVNDNSRNDWPNVNAGSFVSGMEKQIRDGAG